MIDGELVGVHGARDYPFLVSQYGYTLFEVVKIFALIYMKMTFLVWILSLQQKARFENTFLLLLFHNYCF